MDHMDTTQSFHEFNLFKHTQRQLLHDCLWVHGIFMGKIHFFFLLTMTLYTSFFVHFHITSRFSRVNLKAQLEKNTNKISSSQYGLF